MSPSRVVLLALSALPALTGCDFNITAFDRLQNCAFYDGTVDCSQPGGGRPPSGPGPTSLVITATNPVVGTATWDPDRLWGTRCEVTIYWSVVGPSSVVWAPGSHVDWYQNDAEGQSGPFTAPWSPQEFFGMPELAANSSGSSTTVWIGGNDGTHPDSPPWWERTVVIRYDTPVTSERKETRFQVICQPPS